MDDQSVDDWRARYEQSIADEQRRQETENDDSVWHLGTFNTVGRVLIGVVFGLGALMATGNGWLIALSIVLSAVVVLAVAGVLLERARRR